MNLYIKIIGCYFIIINLIGYFSMLMYNKKAIKNEWRIKESTLLLVAVLGGSIGSYLGMKHFKHKTKHVQFKVGIPIIIVCQTVLISFILYKTL